MRRYCQQPGCSGEATKHLTYTPPGQPTGGASGGGAQPREYHANLCDEHLLATRKHRGGLVRELDEQCSPNCPDRDRG